MCPPPRVFDPLPMFDSHTVRALALGIVIGVGVAGGTTSPRATSASAADAAPPRDVSLAADPILFTGNEWDQFTGEERDAFLQGFITGAAAHQASKEKGSAAGRAVAARAALLKRRGALTIPYRENVYRAHLDDWFFYKDRRTQTLIEVIVDASGGSRHGRPQE